ncbi:MAG: ABC transporter ATP-binding protein [Rhodospirillales bacterium]|nr:ABC transporter ATP-binding protein [Rhodospirillales bacterium]
MTEPILELRHLEKRFGQTVAAKDLSFAVMAGEFFTLLGPSGSGKSTVLRIIAGLEPPDSGTIILEGRDISAAPPWERNLGMMFQQYAIFPHMTAAENIAYGLKVRRVEPAAIRRRVDEMLALVGLAGTSARRATLLSGGEQQRVALARALAPSPRILLLDEPLSALDERIRRLMQAELKHIHQNIGTTFIYVTHDQEEALTMSDRIAVLNRGTFVQCDAPEPLYKRPRTRFVAEFFRGFNVLSAQTIAASGGRITIRLAGHEIATDAPDEHRTRDEVHIAVRSENVRFGPQVADHAIQLPARAREILYRGTAFDYRFELPDGQSIIAMTTRHVPLAAAEPVTLSIDRADLIVLAD